MAADQERTRYIAFHPPTPRPPRHRFNQEVGPPTWRLTVYEEDAGILKVPHTDAKKAWAALEDMGAEPITTSGTIRAAKRRAGL